MKLVGITGNIGSGKSTVCRLFSALGIPVFDSDHHAKLQYQKPSVIKNVVDVCGDAILKDGCINLDGLKEFAFKSNQNANSLTDIISESLMQDFNEFVYVTGGYVPFVLFESAILYKRGLETKFDKTIAVLSDKETRYKRVFNRNGFTYEFFNERDSLQSTDDELISKSDYVINNYVVDDNGFVQLKNQVDYVYKSIKES